MILGFDTATAATAVALLLDGGEEVAAYETPDAGERPAHATRLLELAAELLARTDLGWTDVDRVAVGIGPGTFTGLRIGVASARGLAQSLGVPLIGVSTLRTLAGAASGGPPGRRVLAVLDARRGEVYLAGYRDDLELVAVHAVAPSGVARLLGPVTDGGPPQTWLGVGDGAIRFREDLEAAGIEVPADSSHLHRVSAAVTCRLALAAPQLHSLGVVPDYHRRPDAEISRATRPP